MSLEANSVHVSPRYGLLNSAYFKALSKNRHGNFAVSSFVGFSIEGNIHESESKRTLLAKASKLNCIFITSTCTFFPSSLFRQ